VFCLRNSLSMLTQPARSDGSSSKKLYKSGNRLTLGASEWAFLGGRLGCFTGVFGGGFSLP